MPVVAGCLVQHIFQNCEEVFKILAIIYLKLNLDEILAMCRENEKVSVSGPRCLPGHVLRHSWVTCTPSLSR